MSEKSKADIIRDLAAAKDEAKEKMNELSDDALAQVVSGNNSDRAHCPNCGGTITPIGSTICLNCLTVVSTKGDERDMDEALADINGLMTDVDGFAE